MLEKFKAMGVLRNLMHLLAIAFIFLLPFAEPMWHPEGTSELVMGAMIPATAPIIFIIMMFDLLMIRVMQSGAEAPMLAVQGLIARTHLLIGGIMMLLWAMSFSGALFE
ncbi:MAG: hypothetical protein ACI8PP_001811 [Candidatus Pseudothioglobus sp.]|jgi:hypothetical protein